MRSFYSYTLQELNLVLEGEGFHKDLGSYLFNWFYKKKKIENPQEKFSKRSHEFILKNFDFYLPRIIKTYESSDNTVKFLIELEDKKQIESVLIPFYNKYSLCVSSQVGCAMKCSFCFTGKQGLSRSLKVEEIIGQYLVTWHWLNSQRPQKAYIPNVVFMGQGEPLHNFENVKRACQILTSQNGCSLANQKITVSTSGYLPGLKKWAQDSEMPQTNLALSLHSTRTDVRNKLIPINKAFPLKEVLEEIDRLPLEKKQFVTFEYLMIKDLNDQPEEAKALSELLKNKRALVNLIPFNPFPESNYQRPELQRLIEFKKVLDQFKIPTMIRTTKGDDILAACGQLNTSSDLL